MAKARLEYTGKRYLMDKNLVGSVREFGVDVDSTFADLDEKFDILGEYGYRSLRGEEELADVGDAQLGVAFKRIYENALENIARFEAERDAERLARVPRKLNNPFFNSALKRFVVKNGRKPENYYEWENVAEECKGPGLR
jgi:hypothetical protein